MAWRLETRGEIEDLITFITPEASLATTLRPALRPLHRTNKKASGCQVQLVVVAQGRLNQYRRVYKETRGETLLGVDDVCVLTVCGIEKKKKFENGVARQLGKNSILRAGKEAMCLNFGDS